MTENSLGIMVEKWKWSEMHEKLLSSRTETPSKVDRHWKNELVTLEFSPVC